MAPPSNFVAPRRVILGGAEGVELILSIVVLVNAELSDSFG